MRIIPKTLCAQDGAWQVLAAVADHAPQPMQRTAVLAVLQEERGEQSLLALMDAYALGQAVEQGELMVLCPQMPETGWSGADEAMAEALLCQRDDRWWGGWMGAGDLHYLLGIGTGADLVCGLTAKRLTAGCAAAMGAIRPRREIEAKSSQGSLPVLLVDAPASVNAFFASMGPHTVCQASRNFDPATLWPWMRRFRRINTSPAGDAALRTPVPAYARIQRDVLLGDGLRHSWIEAPPASCEGPMPLMLVSHGMGDDPAQVAEQTGMHAVGQREGFLTVYPMASNGHRWNLTRSAGMPDDLAYYEALIGDLCDRYPIDRTRIYVSGFSNGAGMAMLFALTHPEWIAAACPIDSTYPYATTGRFKPAQGTAYLRSDDPPRPFILPPTETEAALAPLKEAMAGQQARAVPLRLPVMYFYGTRESEFPVRTGSNQELSSRFWRAFNGIGAPPADDTLEGSMAVGTPGEEIRTYTPDPRYPQHQYTEHIYRTPEGLDAYHFLLMHGKAHEVHPIEAELGWRYVSRFARQADGQLKELDKETRR